jgi:hypothetical protein
MAAVDQQRNREQFDRPNGRQLEYAKQPSSYGNNARDTRRADDRRCKMTARPESFQAAQLLVIPAKTPPSGWEGPKRRRSNADGTSASACGSQTTNLVVGSSTAKPSTASESSLTRAKATGRRMHRLRFNSVAAAICWPNQVGTFDVTQH